MRKIFSSLYIIGLCPLTCISQEVKVSFVTPSIVRVQWDQTGRFEGNNTGSCVYLAEEVSVSQNKTDQFEEFVSSQLIVRVDSKTQAVTFIDKQSGKTLLNEAAQQPHSSETVIREKIIYDESSAHTEETANGQVTVKDVISRDTIGQSTRFVVRFDGQQGEALYGLGSHMEDYLNLVGKTMYLTQHNLKAMIPMLSSTEGYGLMFDAGCAMKFVSDGKGYSMQMEAAKEIDYYFIKGEKLDNVVAGYRYLTGPVSLMPRYVFGYTQSKERYVSSEDLINTLREYRRRHVPIDMIVQDWNYWPEGWGYMKMNPKYYPDPKALADSIHSMNARLMVSIWPNPQWCPEAEDFKQRGMMLEHDVYDVFNPEARKHYWSYANNEFFSRGFDAWWCDSSEPLDGDWNQLPKPENGRPYGWNEQERRWNLNKEVLSEALGSERSSLYSLYHSMGIYENQRAMYEVGQKDAKRVVNLTRSTYSGQQRYGTIVWNGDTHASWESFRQQIPSGLNYMATGSPYWTVDVGSFFTRGNNRQWFYRGAFPEGVKDEAYREYYVRMFQWGTFLPVLRSHGSDTPREIWRFGEEGTPFYDAILKMIHLRYSMVPYLYSMAAEQHSGSYSMARLLAFDFPEDTEVHDIKDQYMFGDFLACPVTSPSVKTRRVYLPKGTRWMDYWTKQDYDGGQWIEAATPIDQLPLYVRQGAIIPTTEVAEYTEAQIGKPVTINVYPGKSNTFVLYEDEGDNYRYEQQACSRIALAWDDAKRTLTIMERQGSFEGMQQTRTFIVQMPNGKSKTVTYKGRSLKVKL